MVTAPLGMAWLPGLAGHGEEVEGLGGGEGVAGNGRPVCGDWRRSARGDAARGGLEAVAW